MSGNQRERGKAGSPLTAPYPTFNIITERDSNSLFAQGWISDKPCVTIDTRLSVTIGRPDVDTRWPKRKPSQCYMPQKPSGETLQILQDTLVELTLE
jgi:hypothetical protein